MKKICAISGMTLTTASHFSNFFTRHVHPIMEVETTQLLSLIGSKSWFEWELDEAKLLYLALANSIEMLDMVQPAIANPSMQTIASSIENLVAIAGWHTVRQFPLPCLRIQVANGTIPSNESMFEFPALLTTIIASRAQTREDDKIALEALRLEETIKILYARCSIGANKHKMLRTKAADWAIKITAQAARQERIPAEITALWRQMLITPPIDAHKFSDADISELDEFMVTNLPHGCSASYEVMKHLTGMKEATIGLATFLGIDNVIKVITSIPENAPVELDFTTKLEFLIAKAQYQQAVAAAQVPEPVETSSISFELVPTQELELAADLSELQDEGDNDDNI